MRWRRRWGLPLLALVLLPACYESDSPLDATPRLPVDAALIGTWRCLPFDANAKEEPATMTVKADGAREYAVRWGEGEKDPDQYRAYLSSVANWPLLNVQELKDGKPRGKWVFVRHSFLRPSVLQLQVVADDLLKDVEKSPAVLRRTLEKERKNPRLYVDFGVCVRARD